VTWESTQDHHLQHPQTSQPTSFRWGLSLGL